jgi:hypothetical protein
LSYPTNAARGAFESRNDWRTFERAKQVAHELNRHRDSGPFLAIDSGPYVSPRYDVIERPQIGDKVSYSFNGDSYPDGEVVAISESLKLVRTSTGSKYYRRGDTGRWVKAGGTWSLIQGHVNERNPHF